MNDNLIDYIFYYAFENSIKCERKYYVKIESLHDYRIEILELLKRNIETITKNQPEEIVNRIKKFIASNEELTIEKERELIEEIVNNKPSHFWIEDNIIYLDKKVPYCDIAEKRYAINDPVNKYISSLLFRYACNIKAYEKLGITKIVEDVKKLIRIERLMIEAANDLTEDNKNLINIGNFYIKGTFLSLIKKPFEYITEIYKIINDLFSNDNYVAIITDKLLLEDTRENDRFFLKNAYIDDNFSNLFQRAIFLEEDLSYSTLFYYYDELWSYLYKDEIDDNLEFSVNEDLEDSMPEEEYLEEENDEEYNPNVERMIDLYFYLYYIKQIDYYKKRYNDDSLDLTKNRLIYSLKAIDSNIIDKNYSEKTYKILSNKETDIDNYYDKYVMARVLLNDILKGNIDEKILKKILFISCYYDLTYDSRIEKLLDRIKNSNNYLGLCIYKAIINKEYDKFSKKGIQKIKTKLKESQ